jgi:hypothetical protein
VSALDERAKSQEEDEAALRLDFMFLFCSIASPARGEAPMLLTALALSLFLMAAAVRVNEHAA